ncbi:MAG: hypothetical protein LBQ12_04700, partial [Deltaproteobacteria bacterium]|nr:hypothetical protein [Deltaproteobacteria bacterium]
MDPIAVNDLCDSPDFVRRVAERAGRVSLWDRVFRGADEARPANVMRVFADPDILAGVDDGPDPGDPDPLARAKELSRAVAGKDPLPPGVKPGVLIVSALNAPPDGAPDEALRLRLISFLRLVLPGLRPDPRSSASLMEGLLSFPERERLAGLHARALATAAVTLLNMGDGGAREADRFL